MAQQELKLCVTLCFLLRTQQFPIQSEGTKSREVAQCFGKFSVLKVAQNFRTKSREDLMSQIGLGTDDFSKENIGLHNGSTQLLLSH